MKITALKVTLHLLLWVIFCQFDKHPKSFLFVGSRAPFKEGKFDSQMNQFTNYDLTKSNQFCKSIQFCDFITLILWILVEKKEKNYSQFAIQKKLNASISIQDSGKTIGFVNPFNLWIAIHKLRPLLSNDTDLDFWKL